MGAALRAFRILVALLACFVGVCAALAQKPVEKPRVPPGADPGGVAVAIIGHGIDYTRPEFAARLARDGEGEIIGWDFVDNDRRPLDRCHHTPDVRTTCASDHAAAVVRSMVQRDLNPRLVVIRASTAMPQSLVQSVQLVSQSPARIALVVPEGAVPVPRTFLEQAARRFPSLLIVGELNLTETADPGEVAHGNLRIVHAAHLHVAEAALLLSSEASIDASRLNQRIFGGSLSFRSEPRPVR